MDIIEAVESIRSYKKEVVESLDMASALHEIAAIRERKQRAWNKHDALVDRANSFGLVSGAYGPTGAVRSGRNREQVQDMLAEASDLMKAIRKDHDLLYDALEIVEPIVEAIPDYDTRLVIERKYMSGCSDEELCELFSDSGPAYVQEVERKYFQSLR